MSEMQDLRMQVYGLELQVRELTEALIKTVAHEMELVDYIEKVLELKQAAVDDDDNPWQVMWAMGYDAALINVRSILSGSSVY